jgi:hypothetical protein
MLVRPTLSEVRAWDIDHLAYAATHWTNAANRWDDVFTDVAQRMDAASGIRWNGPAADSAQARARADLRRVTSLADQVHSVAGVARAGGPDLIAAKQRVLAAIGEAHGAGFLVEEDLSVTDRQTDWSPAEQRLRETQAEAFAAEIQSRAITLADLDRELADRIASATMVLRDEAFEADTGPAIEAVEFQTAPLPEKPPNPAPQPPPGGWSSDPIARAAQKIAYGHAFGEHRADFTGMTRAQLAQQIENMFRANVDDPGSLSIGRSRDGAPVLYDPKTNLIVIRDPRALDDGTAFRPDDGAKYAETRKMASRTTSIPLSELADGPIKSAAPVDAKVSEPPPPRAAPSLRAVPIPIPPSLVELPQSSADSDLPVLDSSGQHEVPEDGTER